MTEDNQDELYRCVFDAVHNIKPVYKQSILNQIDFEIEKIEDEDEAAQEADEGEMEELELQEDIYCFTYFKFIHDYNPAVQKDLIIKCMVTYIF